MLAYAKVSLGGRIELLRKDPVDGCDVIINDEDSDVLIHPGHYRYVAEMWIYNPPPSIYHKVDVNGDWVLDQLAITSAQNIIWERIKLHRDTVEEGGVLCNINGVDHWFHTDIHSLIKYIGLLIITCLFPAYFPQGLKWKPMDTFEEIDMTPQNVIQIFFAVCARSTTLYSIGANHRRAMLLVDNPYEYDYTTGWPQTYEDTPQ